MSTRRFAAARTTKIVVSLLIAAMWFYAFVLEIGRAHV